MTRLEWVAQQVSTSLSLERAEQVADTIQLLAYQRSGREIEDWQKIGDYIHGRELNGLGG